jgi:branched-chain amino acid transport system permease protein
MAEAPKERGMIAARADAAAGEQLKRWAARAAAVGIWFLPLIFIDVQTYIILTVAGAAMGMLLFLAASGLTLIFGLMDVLNLAHGAFFAWGAYVGFSVLNALNAIGWVETGTLAQSMLSLAAALAVSVVVGLVLGFLLERIIIRHVYGDHLKQILITMGSLTVLVELLIIFWGPNDEVVLVPRMFEGSYDLFDVIINKFRVAAIVVGVLVFAAMQLVLRKTKLGILVRGGVENPDIVRAMGYNIHAVFTGVFAVGAALATLGGTMWAIFKEQIHPGMGVENLIFALIVVIIGGLGSVSGSFIGAVMVGLAFNYVAFLLPKLALGVNILIMAVILLIRPAGLMGKK